MRSDQEHEIQKHFIKWVRLNQIRIKELQLLYAIPNGGHRHIKVAKKMKSEGQLAGVPDLHLPVPMGGYASLYLETKTPTGRQTSNQKSFAALLEACGNKYVICRSTVELINATKEYLNQ